MLPEELLTLHKQVTTTCYDCNYFKSEEVSEALLTATYSGDIESTEEVLIALDLIATVSDDGSASFPDTLMMKVDAYLTSPDAPHVMVDYDELLNSAWEGAESDYSWSHDVIEIRRHWILQGIAEDDYSRVGTLTGLMPMLGPGPWSPTNVVNAIMPRNWTIAPKTAKVATALDALLLSDVETTAKRPPLLEVLLSGDLLPHLVDPAFTEVRNSVVGKKPPYHLEKSLPLVMEQVTPASTFYIPMDTVAGHEITDYILDVIAESVESYDVYSLEKLLVGLLAGRQGMTDTLHSIAVDAYSGINGKMDPRVMLEALSL